MRFILATLLLALGIVGLGWFHFHAANQKPLSPATNPPIEAQRMLRDQPVGFVPNLGQWQHTARFVQRSGALTLFLEDRGWVVGVQERCANENRRGQRKRVSPGEPHIRRQHVRSTALRMSFVGSGNPLLVGEARLPGHHNYFLGDDRSRWRTEVPLYAAVAYVGMYPGIDVRLRHADGHPEYDLLLSPGADLSHVSVRVEGAKGLRLADDGSLVIDTALGPIVQPVARTWQVRPGGERQPLPCRYVLLGQDRFGFSVNGWVQDSRLVIDPGLLYSTFLGGNVDEWANGLVVRADGTVTICGTTQSSNFPTSTGAYDTIHAGLRKFDGFVTQLDPGKIGGGQLVYSTFLGGDSGAGVCDLAVGPSGVITITGSTSSSNFPTTTGAYDTTFNGATDAFLSRLDPSKAGAGQLIYSTFLGKSGRESGIGLVVDASGMITVTGSTNSSNFPTTTGAYDTTFNGATDAFISRLDPSKTPTNQLVYSTLLGGVRHDNPSAVSVSRGGVITITGGTDSSNLPTTTGAYNTNYNGNQDAFISRLDPTKANTNQLVYSTFVGGPGWDWAWFLAVDSKGVATIAGETGSTNLPTTAGAYDRTHNGGRSDAFVMRLDPSLPRASQLVYSTFLGGSGFEGWGAGGITQGPLAVDAKGVVTVAGQTSSTDFPTTPGAYDRTYNGGSGPGDLFVARLDPSLPVLRQLVYSTYLGTNGREESGPFALDPSGCVWIAAVTWSSNFPTTTGAYNSTHAARRDLFVARLDMGVALHGDVHEISIGTGGTQKLTVNAGKAHAKRLYWVFGSITGTTPGVTLSSATRSVNIPLNPDIWTDHTIALANTATLTNTKATLDASGTAQASFNIPKVNLPSAIGLVFHHAYLVYDAKNNFHMASNAVPLKLVR